tara:strand:+ start:1834 stop:2046 length:213 start_codon:yes stop_codon:yes gene_type:complete
MKKVIKVWAISPQEMLDYIIDIDKMNSLCYTHYVGKGLDYIRSVYESYIGIDTMSEQEQIDNGYYKLIIN